MTLTGQRRSPPAEPPGSRPHASSTTRNNPATSYWSAGWTGEAIPLQEQVLADAERILGADHPDTLTTRNNLAFSYRSAGRTGEAIQLQERVLADAERILGADHPDTVGTRSTLEQWKSS